MSDRDYFGLGLILFVIVAICTVASCTMKSWRYDECLMVGHSETYCKAEFIGCVGRR